MAINSPVGQRGAIVGRLAAVNSLRSRQPSAIPESSRFRRTSKT